MIKNVLSVDVEEWFHPEAVHHLFPIDSWPSQEKRVQENVDRLLNLFAAKNARATFFILGWVAKNNPGMVKRIAAAGHEIGTHGNSHRMVTKLTPQEFRDDLQESLHILQDISSQPVIGFRAPTFSIVNSTLWALDILREVGIKYDSSVYPIWHDRYGIPNAPRQPYLAAEKDDCHLIEFPMPTLQILNKNIPFGGGGYLRIFPLWFTAMAIKRFNKQGASAIVYMHPWEFDADQPRLNLGRIQTWRHYYNIKSNLKKLGVLLERFTWTSFGAVLDETRKHLFEKRISI